MSPKGLSSFRGAFDDARKNAARAALFGGIFVLGLIPWVLFLVLGLGQVLEGRYWLSALIVSLVHLTVGGFYAYQYEQKAVHESIHLPPVKNLMPANLSQKVTEIRDNPLAILAMVFIIGIFSGQLLKISFQRRGEIG